MNHVTRLELDDRREGFYITTDDGVFSINRIDDNFYFKPEEGYGINDQHLNKNSFYTFKVKKEFGDIYDTIDDLYKAVESRKPYSNSIYDFEEKNYVMPAYIDINDESKLMKDGMIKWHSDECDYDKASVLIIAKGDDLYKITFEESAKTKTSSPTFTVKIGISSPRYYCFSTTFLSMYQKIKKDYEKSKGFQRVRK